MRIALIDDHLLLLQALKQQIEALDSNYKLEFWTDPLVYLQSEAWKNSDLLLLDIHFEHINGFDFVKILREKGFCAKIILLSGAATSFNLQRAIDLGVNGFIGKDSSSEELKEAILATQRDDFFIGKSVEPIAKKLLRQSPKSKLSEREIEIVRMIAQGLGYKEIGAQLFISPRTVEAHRNNILEKLGLSNNTELIRFALRNHLI